MVPGRNESPLTPCSLPATVAWGPACLVESGEMSAGKFAEPDDAFGDLPDQLGWVIADPAAQVAGAPEGGQSVRQRPSGDVVGGRRGQAGPRAAVEDGKGRVADFDEVRVVVAV